MNNKKTFKQTRVVIRIDRPGLPSRYYDGSRATKHPDTFGTQHKYGGTVFFTARAAKIIINRLYEQLRRDAQVGYEESQGRGGGFSEEERRYEETTITMETIEPWTSSNTCKMQS